MKLLSDFEIHGQNPVMLPFKYETSLAERLQIPFQRNGIFCYNLNFAHCWE